MRGSHGGTDHCITHRGVSIPFSLKRTRRRTVGIRISPDSAVTVSAPHSMPLERIISLVGTKGDWILKKRKEFSERNPDGLNGAVSAETLRDGMALPYLGEKYLLRTEVLSYAGRAARPKIALTESTLSIVFTAPAAAASPAASPAAEPEAAGVLRTWYRKEAERVISVRFRRVWETIPPGRIPGKPEFRLRRMKRRWGSCAGDGIITLNPYLVCVPVPCIDYVIIHELCHRVEHNHGSAYYRFLGSLMPDWKDLRKQLKRQPFIYL